LTRENISLDCVWNMDETGVTTAMTPDTVMTPEKIVGRRGQKQIGNKTINFEYLKSDVLFL
jgi:hypothetical protein